VRLDRALESIRFMADSVDQCVFNRTANANQCTVTLNGVLEEAAVTGRAASPGASSLFSQGTEQKLGRKETANFHSVVAKLLHLTTKVKGPTLGDQQKLANKYLAQTRDLQLKIETQMRVKSFIDASFATHEYGKGHTGVVVQIGGATVFSRSTKQRIGTKDSTEFELAGLSDMPSNTMKMHEFVCGQGALCA